MALLRETELSRELSAKDLRPFYFFFGPEYLKIRDWLASIEKLIGKGLQREVFYGDELELETLLSACQTLSLFQEKKLILLRTIEKIRAEAWEAILPLLEMELANTTIIFLAEEVDQRKRPIQALLKAKQCAAVKSEFVVEKEYFAWARELAQKRKKKIGVPAVQMLWERIGPSLLELDQALEKAALYGAENPEITSTHIESVVVKTRQELVFAFTDAVSLNDKKSALLSLGALYSQGEEPIAIVALLVRQYRWMLEIAARLEQKQRIDDIARDLGLFSKLAKALHAAVKRQGLTGVLRGLDSLRAADLALKSSMEPARFVLDRLTLDLFSESC